jgi:predicted ABC-type ATPase
LKTTLASKTFAPWIDRLIRSGYDFHLVFLWVPSVDFAIERVAQRVRAGGHSVPEEVIRRRYTKGIANFFSLYQPLATSWRVYNNSRGRRPKLIAAGRERGRKSIRNAAQWRAFKGLA